ncbi:MAG: hypothetical protein KGJ66_09260 [Alphaproteobacteria bacterium]|jgi:hypothetical protein|nr:hypothetical protein [Alphaproteobacteria bacterium]
MSKLGIAVAAVLALAAASVAIWAWISLGAVQMSASGYIALVLGGVATLGLAGGLIALLFYSHNKGFDDAAGGRRIDDDKPR